MAFILSSARVPEQLPGPQGVPCTALHPNTLTAEAKRAQGRGTGSHGVGLHGWDSGFVRNSSWDFCTVLLTAKGFTSCFINGKASTGIVRFSMLRESENNIGKVK